MYKWITTESEYTELYDRIRATSPNSWQNSPYFLCTWSSPQSVFLKTEKPLNWKPFSKNEGYFTHYIKDLDQNTSKVQQVVFHPFVFLISLKSFNFQKDQVSECTFERNKDFNSPNYFLLENLLLDSVFNLQLEMKCITNNKKPKFEHLEL